MAVALGSCLFACHPSTERPAEPPPKSAADAASAAAKLTIPQPIAQGGGQALGLDALRLGFDQARILESWRAARLARLDALENVSLRRRVVRDILKTRILRAEFVRRDLQVDVARFDELVRKAVLGVKPDKPIPRSRLPEDEGIDDIDARLVARFEATASQVRRVALDLVERERLTEALLDEVEPRALKPAWMDANTTVSIELIRIPRVPTPSEIDAVVQGEHEAIAAYYHSNLRLFQRPEKAFVRRLLIPVKDPSDTAALATATETAEKLRAEVTAGADLPRLVLAHGIRADHRNRGRLTVTPKRNASLFGLEKNTLTAVQKMDGGVGFYRIEGYAPAMNRPLLDPRVQREAAAAILRASDRLPHARRIAQQVRALMAQSPTSGELEKLVGNRRLRRAQTPPFSRAGGDRVPTIGLAPSLFAAAFQLTPERPMTDIIQVRQDYVVARLITRADPTEAAWSQAKEAYRTRWRARMRPRIVDEWVRAQFAKAPLQLDKARLDGLSVDALRPGTAAPAP